MNTTLYGDMRVSDADRDRALAELSEHFQAGRLDGDEFEERSGRALRARTAGELADLFGDLPREYPQAQVADPFPAGWSRHQGGVAPAQFSLGRGVLVGVVAFSLIALVADVVAGHHGLGPSGYGGSGVAGIVVVLFVVRFAARRHDGWQ